ncbi:hypothetical protein [Haloarcula litorea]|uniref:hypothetical protein n=1 Tax=Haloarcula litorea TaxID=3032579 RepID=UPI0023E869BA|nr:hypothetical protein [Halomicroarcula sp. GDY20]
MYAVQYTGHGGTDVVTYEEVPDPTVGRDEALVFQTAWRMPIARGELRSRRKAGDRRAAGDAPDERDGPGPRAARRTGGVRRGRVRPGRCGR